MKQLLKHPRFPLFALSLAGLGMFTWLLLGFLATSNEEKRLEQVQAQLVEAIAENRRGKVRALVHKDYADSLGHDRLQALARIFELRSQVAELTLQEEFLGFEAMDESAGEATLTMRFTELSGQGGLFGDVMIPRLRLSGVMEAKVTTGWKRTGIWPGRWKLVALEFDENLRVPASYDPAKSLKEQVQGGFGVNF